MTIDRAALDEMQAGRADRPVLRFFQWDRPTVTYGYLLDPEQVKKWVSSIDHSPSTIDYAKRPTGGGAVLHTLSDLSLSLLWPRASRLFPDTPRACYAEIHALIMKSIMPFFSSPQRGEGRVGELILRNSKSSSIACAPQGQIKENLLSPSPYPLPAGEGDACSSNTSKPRFSVCFQEPVCNDVMLGDKKIVGGALRITKQATLYQGTIQIPGTARFELLKQSLIDLLTRVHGS